MPESEPNDKSPKKWTAQATEKVLGALNRADEIGGEIRDYLQDKVATDPRYVAARKRVASLLGKRYESKVEVAQKAQDVATQQAAAAAELAKDKMAPVASTVADKVRGNGKDNDTQVGMQATP